MSIFVDTSAFYALLDTTDRYHEQSANALVEFRRAGQRLLTTSYVVVESCALIQKRLGMSVVGTFRSSLLPVVAVRWVEGTVHEEGFDLLLTCARGGPSFVDCVSFAFMRRSGMRTAFTFDRHFAEQGFECIP
jgi:predicted nucleic acid-binding protein